MKYVDVIETTCVVCGCKVILDTPCCGRNCAGCQKNVPTDPSNVATKYWKVLPDKSIRPYCSCECGLKYYEENK